MNARAARWPTFTAVMAELERSIRETLAEKDDGQLQFGLDCRGKSSSVNVTSGLRARLAQIPGELLRETAHLRDRYRDPKPRLFPVAVTFLVPHRAISQLHPGGSR